MATTMTRVMVMINSQLGIPAVPAGTAAAASLGGGGGGGDDDGLLPADSE